MADEQPILPADRRWQLSVDLRDVIGAAGVFLAVAGAAAIHWGAAVFMCGAGLVALAYRVARH